MKTGFITFETMTYDEFIPTASELGFEYVEIMMPYIASGNELGREYLSTQKEEISTALERADIDLQLHLPHAIDIAAPSEQIRQAGVAELKDCLDVADELDVNKAVIHPTSSARKRTWDDDIVREWILDSIRELDDYGEECGVELCMENIPGSRFTIGDFDQFFAETDCSMTLDIGHARISGHDDTQLAAFLEERHDRVSHVHVNDNKQFIAGTGGRPADDHVPTGSGDTDFARILEPLVETGWPGTLSLEVQTQNLEYIAVSKEQFDTMLRKAENVAQVQ